MASSSPRSSNGDTRQETPSSNITAVSPETMGTVNSSTSTQPRFKLSVTTDGPISTQRVVANRVGDDVFLNEPASTSAIGSSQLSPVAEEFNPYLTPSATASRSGYYCSNMPGGSIRTDPGIIGSGTPVSNLLSGSVPDDFDGRTFGRSARPPMATLVEESHELAARIDDLTTQLEDISLTRPLLQFCVVDHGTFSTDDQTGRAILVCGIPTSFPESVAQNTFNRDNYPSLIGVSYKHLSDHGVIIVKFSNILDADKLERFLRYIEPSWTTRRISPKQYTTQALNIPTDGVSDYEAQVTVSVVCDDALNILAAEAIHTMMQTLLTFGVIKAIKSLSPSKSHTRKFRVEYDDTESAMSALKSLDLVLVGRFIFKVELYHPDLVIEEGLGTAGPLGRGPQVLSATGRSLIPMPQPSSIGGRGRNSMFSSPPRRGRDRYDANGNHNQVIIEKIECGMDVRTTIMLRNIPNKITSAMLKEILDETSHGAYDFMYLRIDFANNCNVGYAFINFIDALAIIPFALRRAGQRWFSSDKVAEISYATIQGKDCLVQKFRNSSVMLEDPAFRPKLFGTGTGPDAGDEEPFPGPDNVSKMRRSVENAEHVGLFIRFTRPSPTRTQTRASTSNSWRLPQTGTRTNGYLSPARASLWANLPITPHTSVHTPSTPTTPPRRRTRVVYTPSTSTEDSYPSPPQCTPVGTSRVDITRGDDPFSASRTVGRRTAPQVESYRLFAPRQGQAFREEQRRRRSQFDRGTPGAEFEAYNYRLTDPALSPIRTPCPPRSTGYGSNLGSYTGAVYGPGTPSARPGYGYY